MVYSGNLIIFSENMFKVDINFEQFYYQKYT
jgi:hypothetical protein